MLGFLKDLRRLNVAITRPKYFLFVVGNSRTLSGDSLWDNMIKGCKEQPGGYFNLKKATNSYKEIVDDLTRAYELRSKLANEFIK